MNKSVPIKLVSLFVYIFVLFSVQKTFSQEIAKPINDHWRNLKIQLQHRIDIVSALSSQYSAAFENTKLQIAKKASLDLKKYIDSLNYFDSISVSLLNKKNTIMQVALSEALATLKNKSAFKDYDKVETIMLQLEAMENRIVLARKEYNDGCKENNRPDLMFDVKSSKVPSIEF